MNTLKTPLEEHEPAAQPVKQTTAINVLTFGAIGLLLYLAHAAFIPIALALLCALILSGPVEALYKARVPRALSATIIVIVAMGLLAGAVTLMWAPIQGWYAAAPQTVRVIKRKLNPAIRFITHVEELRSSAGSIGASGQAAPSASAAADKESAPVLIFDATREVMVSLLTFVIVTLFLLAGGPPMLARMTAAFVDDFNAGHVLNIIEKVRGEVGRFYVTTAIINVALGCATAGAMILCGMPTPYLWGLIAGGLNFIPYAGSTLTLIIVTVVAFVTFDNVGRVLAVTASYLLLAMLEGQIIQPLFVGRRLKINPLLIFLALWFGGLFWGLAGVILATPALLTLKVIAEHSVGGKSVMSFLGPNDQSPEAGNTLKKLVGPMVRKSAQRD
ncbi:MAG: AI-2E family transporter [Gammaproteobacteria bacterium]